MQSIKAYIKYQTTANASKIFSGSTSLEEIQLGNQLQRPSAGLQLFHPRPHCHHHHRHPPPQATDIDQNLHHDYHNRHHDNHK